MKLTSSLSILSVHTGLAVLAAAAPGKRASPTVTLDDGTFTGVTSGKVNKWLGIPFAKPPVGNLRFNLPEPVDPYTGTQSVTAYGPACPQQSVDLPLINGLAGDAIDFIVNTIYGVIFPDDEDCLTINVVAPTGVNSTSKLPVVAWIFGGGFELGSPSMYDGTVIVDRSIAIGEPVIYVSMNYRQADRVYTAWGFLASQEVKDAGVGNLGLRDQRVALQWVQKYISNFGGDPSKVTIWGESAGAISVGMQMVANNGDNEGLFRAGFMQSGSPLPVGDIVHGQKYYDALVDATGCSGSSDTLQCLREVPYDKLNAAVNEAPSIFSYQSLSLAYLPRVDGDFITDAPQKLVEAGKVANVPFITGDCDDEGTLFGLANANITTEAELKEYFLTYYAPDATDDEVAAILAAYPADVTKGSPFDTGVLNAITPQFKRIAALLGDLVFNAPRRFMLQQRAGKQNAWSYLSKRLKALPVLGSAHATDILNVYADGDMTEYLVRFAATLDPNGGSLLSWPKYTTSAPTLMTFLDGSTPEQLSQDTFREDGFDKLTALSLKYPL
ncbi:carotenoid ester lipase precursor [Peniophora sp. CONT]|nr:carotenoid ester lipase precursor [Peniophora sp. CONT]